ncbi:MAG: hypothetical protein Q9210_000378 [Variospora velana]
MSASAAPIPLERFADALAELPLDTLHAKAAELRNSINHLAASNEQLQYFADDGDAESADAITENRDVIERMRDRIMLLEEISVLGWRKMNEVEKRGDNEPATVNGKPGDQMALNAPDEEGLATVEPTAPDQSSHHQGGSPGDEELAR